MVDILVAFQQFQSTPLSRGATLTQQLFVLSALFQSTPLSRGATTLTGYNSDIDNISIHTPLTRGDDKKVSSFVNRW